MTSTNEPETDPNEPTSNQAKLKRVETQVRRRGDCELLMQLDEVAMIPDRRAAIQGIQALMQRLND